MAFRSIQTRAGNFVMKVYIVFDRNDLSRKKIISTFTVKVFLLTIAYVLFDFDSPICLLEKMTYEIKLLFALFGL